MTTLELRFMIELWTAKLLFSIAFLMRGMKLTKQEQSTKDPNLKKQYWMQHKVNFNLILLLLKTAEKSVHNGKKNNFIREWLKTGQQTFIIHVEYTWEVFTRSKRHIDQIGWHWLFCKLWSLERLRSEQRAILGCYSQSCDEWT